jgi:hypothetical protein
VSGNCSNGNPCSELYTLSRVITSAGACVFVNGSINIYDSGLFNYSISFINSSSSISSILIFHSTSSIISKQELSVSLF